MSCFELTGMLYCVSPSATSQSFHQPLEGEISGHE